METLMENWKHDLRIALTIRKYLENGATDVKVNPIDGDVSFELVKPLHQIN
jgi:hypothetical protein